METELKISMSSEDLEKVLKAFRKEAIAGTFNHKYMPRAYFDTSDLKLYKRQASLRVQYSQGKGGELGSYEQTLKYDLPGQEGKAIFSRREVRDSIDTHTPDLDAITDKDAQKIIDGVSQPRLKHIFTAAVERRVFRMDVDGGRVELAFDKGVIFLAEDKNKSIQISEVEVEVKKGSQKIIEEIRDMILDIAPSAQIQYLSKADQGIKLYSKGKNLGI